MSSMRNVEAVEDGLKMVAIRMFNKLLLLILYVAHMTFRCAKTGRSHKKIAFETIACTAEHFESLASIQSVQISNCSLCCGRNDGMNVWLRMIHRTARMRQTHKLPYSYQERTSRGTELGSVNDPSSIFQSAHCTVSSSILFICVKLSDGRCDQFKAKQLPEDLIRKD